MIQKMITFDNVLKENIKESNTNWPKIPAYPYRMLIVGGAGSEKTNSLFNLISPEPDIGKIYLYPKDLSNQSISEVTATRLEPRTIQFLNEHSTIWPNWPNDPAMF